MTRPSRGVGAAQLRARVVATFGQQLLIEDAARVWQATRRGKRGDVVVGDCVLASATSADQARIESIEPRATLLFRADSYRTKELAANIDQVIIVFAARPAFNPWFIWKALVAADAAGIEALVVRNKTDLGDSDDASLFLQQISRLGWRTLAVSAKVDAERSRALLMSEVRGRKSLLVGQSGMGKSTLLNLLVPDAQARTQEYSQRLNVGKQTTTASRWFPLDGGALVDTPGFHEFGLAHLSLGEIAATFPDFKPLLGLCRFLDCRHLEEPACAIRTALDEGRLAPERYEFYRSLAAAPSK
ncbi:MAG TPA: ribosome small subunit-dependent GTPase A [Burkholderiaceae bacterium]|nr:ribosome small subunit-dependent GTPase A [Burkholderiaceae bacterium]